MSLKIFLSVITFSLFISACDAPVEKNKIDIDSKEKLLEAERKLLEQEKKLIEQEKINLENQRIDAENDAIAREKNIAVITTHFGATNRTKISICIRCIC